MFECACAACLARVVHMITRGSCQADILGVFMHMACSKLL